MTKVAPVVLIVRDGWGFNPHPEMDPCNAIVQADTPVADNLYKHWPSTRIGTCGKNVGLLSGVMGNSEVGHQNIGAGRIVPQELSRLNLAAESGAFANNEVIKEAFERGTTGNSMHIIGLVSDGRVHSDLQHLFALLASAPKEATVFIHVITDGRDCSPSAGLGFVEALEDKIRGTNAKIATVMGRFWAMDRDNRWERVAVAFEAMTGIATTHPLREKTVHVRQSFHAANVVAEYYKSPIDANRSGDEFIVPTQIVDENNDAIGVVQSGDSVLFFNYRGDRPRELSRAFVLDDASWSDVSRGPFNRGNSFTNLYFATMTNYETGLPVSAVAFEKPNAMPYILGETLASNSITQFRCAETEKFPHVTFFFNDYREEPFEGETRLLVPSPTNVATYDQQPEMSAEGVCQGVLDELAKEDGARVIVVNFANGDMVGHTGNLPAIIAAIEVVDACCGKIIEAVIELDGALIITADHGNAERTRDPETNMPDTAHTTYDVPLHVVCNQFKGATLKPDGILADVAPTMLELLGIPSPKEMTGTSLLS